MYREKERPLWQNILLSAIGIIAFLAIWELVVKTGIVSQDKLVSPTQIVDTFFVKLSDPIPDGNTIQVNFMASLKVVLLGFILSCVLGVPLGILMGFSDRFNRFFNPIFEIVRPIPPLAWIPIVIVLLGIGLKAQLFLIFMAAFVPCVINSYVGIRATNVTLINVARTAGASRWQILTKVCIPSALPMIFTGVKISFGSAWATLVAAEMIASSEGLGYMIQQGRNFQRPDIVLLGMVVIGLVGAALTGVITLAEKKSMPWR